MVQKYCCNINLYTNSITLTSYVYSLTAYGLTAILSYFVHFLYPEFFNYPIGISYLLMATYALVLSYTIKNRLQLIESKVPCLINAFCLILYFKEVIPFMSDPYSLNLLLKLIVAYFFSMLIAPSKVLTIIFAITPAFLLTGSYFYYGEETIPQHIKSFFFLSIMASTFLTLFKFKFAKSIEDISKVQTIENKKKQFVALSQLITNISHHINNGLSKILLAQSLLPETQESEIVKTEGMQLAEHIKDLSSILQTLEYDKKESLSLNQSIKNILEQVAQRCKSQNIHLDFDTAYTDYMIAIDPQKLNQLLLNLVNNSIDSIKRKRLVHKRKKIISKNKDYIKIRTSDSLNKVEIVCKDNGLKIEDRVRAGMFDLFYTTKKVGDGMGLGLSISKLICELNNGEISHYRNRNETVFSVKLPVCSKV